MSTPFFDLPPPLVPWQSPAEHEALDPLRTYLAWLAALRCVVCQEVPAVCVVRLPGGRELMVCDACRTGEPPP